MTEKVKTTQESGVKEANVDTSIEAWEQLRDSFLKTTEPFKGDESLTKSLGFKDPDLQQEQIEKWSRDIIGRLNETETFSETIRIIAETSESLNDFAMKLFNVGKANGRAAVDKLLAGIMGKSHSGGK